MTQRFAIPTVLVGCSRERDERQGDNHVGGRYRSVAYLEASTAGAA